MLHPDRASESYKEAALYGHSPDLVGSFYKDTYIGRFRPLTWSYDKLLCLLCGDNTFLFRVSNLVILFFSLFFLLAILSYFQVDRVSTLVVLGIYVFGRNNETWWTLIPPPQNVGEMFLLAGIYYWLLYRKKGVTGLYVFPAMLFFLSDISKESYIFCIPILLLTDYFFFNPSRRLFAKEYLLSMLASMLPFLCLLATVLHSSKIYSYPYPESIFSIMGYNIFQFAGAIGFFIAPIVALAISKTLIGRGNLIRVLFVFTVWTIIQLILLKGIKLNDQHHYLIPWLIYPLIFTAIALTEIRKVSNKWYSSVLVAYGIAILIFMYNTKANVNSYSATLQAYYNMIDTIQKDTAAPEVVYLSDDACERDWIAGTRAVMDSKLMKKELYFTPVSTVVPAWEMYWKEHSPQNAFKHLSLDSAFYPDGKWIILVENPAKNGIINDDVSFYTRADSCFIKMRGKEKFIPGKYYYFSVPYPGLSIGDILRGNFNMENCKGFYAIKLNLK